MATEINRNQNTQHKKKEARRCGVGRCSTCARGVCVRGVWCVVWAGVGAPVPRGTIDPDGHCAEPPPPPPPPPPPNEPEAKTRNPNKRSHEQERGSGEQHTHTNIKVATSEKERRERANGHRDKTKPRHTTQKERSTTVRRVRVVCFYAALPPKAKTACLIPCNAAGTA